MGDEITPAQPMTKAEAKRVTKAIQQTADDLWHLLRQAHEGHAWTVLGYGSWDEYVRSEFNMTRRNANLLVAQGEVIAAIEAALPVGSALPTPAPVSARQAAELKREPDGVAQVAAAVRLGAPPARAVQDVLSKPKSNNGSGNSTADVANQEPPRQLAFDFETAAHPALVALGKKRLLAVQRKISEALRYAR